MINEITIDIKKYIKSKLNLGQYVFLQALYNKDYNFARIVQSTENLSLEGLERAMWIKITGLNLESIYPREKLLDLFQTIDEKLCSTWIEEWISLFPKGIKSGGYYVKSNKEDCLKKMTKFIKTRKYSKEQIFQATKNYIDRKALENYSYMMRAEYFIEKDGTSTLATEISNLGEEVNDDWTRNPLH